MKLLDILADYAEMDIYPMHMPGHKRNYDFMQGVAPYSIDLTEVAGSDNLHNATGILKDSMDFAARLFESYRCWYLINGSTCGLLASIFSISHRGDKILVARNCHKAVYNAMHLSGLFPVYLYPETDPEFGVAGAISPQQVMAALEENPDIKLCIITSPTYDGVVSNVAAISRILHEKGIPLIVDEAHGPHFGFHPFFPKSAITEGADLVIESIHKTLPSPTQTALLHLCSSLWKDRGTLEEMGRTITSSLQIFESTSPSYVLMAGIDNCVHLLADEKESLFYDYLRRLNKFSRGCEQLKYIKVLCKGSDDLKDHPLFYDYDQSKIVMSIRHLSLTSGQFEKIMLQKYKIELEMIAADYASALTSICDTDEGFDRLLNALIEIDRDYGIEKTKSKTFPRSHGNLTKMTISAAKDMHDQVVYFDRSVGQISRELVYAYPPGIPLIVPGEEISETMIEQIHRLFEDGLTVQSSFGELPERIHVVRNGLQ